VLAMEVWVVGGGAGGLFGGVVAVVPMPRDGGDRGEKAGRLFPTAAHKAAASIPRPSRRPRSAPPAKSASTVDISPFMAAQWRAVLPPGDTDRPPKPPDTDSDMDTEPEPEPEPVTEPELVRPGLPTILVCPTESIALTAIP